MVLLVVSAMMPVVFNDHVHGESNVIASGYCGDKDNEGNYGENVKYTVEKIDDENDRLVLEGSGEMAFFSSNHDGWTTRYGFAPRHAPWYSYHDQITSVEIKDGLEKLGSGALCDLTALKEITLPSSIKTLDQCVFMGCEKLTTVHLNEGLNSIGVEVFDYTNVKDLYLPKTVEFVDSTNFKTLGMDHFTFEEGSPFSVKDHIVYAQNGKEMIYGTPELTDGVFHIPNGVEKIDNFAFEANQDIKGVTFPDTLKEIGDAAFYGVPLEGEIVIPDSVTTVGYSIFAHAKITSLIVGDSVKELETTCSNCTQLEKVKLGKSVENLSSTFSDCSSLKEVTLPESLKVIGSYTFDRTALSEITIPDHVMTIGDYSFRECSSLSKVQMGKGVKYLEKYAFYKTNIDHIDLYEGLLTIGGQACDQTKITSVNVPSTVTSCSPDAFPVDCVVTRTASPRTTHLEDQTKTSVKNAIQENKTSSPLATLTSEKKEVVSTVLPQEASKNAHAVSIKNGQKKDAKATSYLPMKLKMKKVGRSQVNLSYQKIKKAKAYIIYMAKGKGAYQFVKKQKKRTYKMKHLKKGQYHFYVEAYDRSNKKIAVSKCKLISTGKKIKKN